MTERINTEATAKKIISMVREDLAKQRKEQGEMRAPSYLEDLVNHDSQKIRKITRKMVSNATDDEYNMVFYSCVTELPDEMIAKHNVPDLIKIVRYAMQQVLAERYKGVSW